MDTRQHLKTQRSVMLREFMRSKTMWMGAALLAALLVGSSFGNDFGTKWFWAIMGFGVGGMFVETLHLLRRNNASQR